ncbi:MAG TPA: serine/threonine protein kinase [Thermoanaerobaculia bacterium]|jgi:serine/threonine protein kinase|nr:serine/threonine protein kinase [Thermoanaerobaculia bacterium]
MQYILSKVPSVVGQGTKGRYTVGSFLGGGGQGEVYVASTEGQDLALKWYFPETATTAQQAALEDLVQRPAPDERFLWPIELVKADDNIGGFGYVMPLREQRFHSLFDLMKGRVDPSFRTLLTAGIALADSYWHLHAKGLCYCDISFGNAFFDPQTGDVAICDNDNVTIDKKSDGRVCGTPRFMAPEVVLGAPPSSDSDRFSLAVLLFYMLHLHHPLEGAKEQAIRCLDLVALRKLFGEEPVFIFDPVDASNRPVRGVQDNAEAYWKIYPQSLHDLFTRVFTVGLRDPQSGRVRETEWRKELARVRDAIFYCPSCAKENFYDPKDLDATGVPKRPCWACGKKLKLPFRLRLNGSEMVMLNHDTRLFGHHLGGATQQFDFTVPLAAVARHPSDPARWGLQNLSTTSWFFTPGDGTSAIEIGPGKTMGLVKGGKISFGPVSGEIRV